MSRGKKKPRDTPPLLREMHACISMDEPEHDLAKLFGLIRGEKWAGCWFSIERGEWHGRAFLDNKGWQTFWSSGPTPERALADLVQQLEAWKKKEGNQ